MHDLNYCMPDLNYCMPDLNYCGITAELLSNRLNYCMPEKIHRGGAVAQTCISILMYVLLNLLPF